MYVYYHEKIVHNFSLCTTLNEIQSCNVNNNTQTVVRSKGKKRLKIFTEMLSKTTKITVDFQFIN